MRRLAGNDPEVNEEWITDKDRFAFHYATAGRPADLPAGPRRGRRARGPASWPEAFAVAARGLRGRRRRRRAHRWPGHRRGRLRLQQVRPGRARHQRHRLPVPPALGRGGVVPRRRGRAAAATVRRTPTSRRAEHRRARRASSPRTRPARSSCGCARPPMHGTTRVVAIAPYATRGLRKMGGHAGPRPRPATRPPRSTALRRARRARRSTATAVILVGERLATVARRADRRGRRWPPRPAPGWPGCRAVPVTAARSRPAACPTCCPVAARSPTPPPASTPPPPGASTACPRPPGRDADAIVAALVAGELGGLVVGGVDPDDTADPAATRAAIDAASFVVALELRETDVTRAADVVFPVAPVDRQGRHVRDLGGPPAHVRRGLHQPAARCPTCGSWPASPRSSAARSASAPSPRRAPRWRSSGPWDGDRAALGRSRGRTAPTLDHRGRSRSPTWKQLRRQRLDAGRRQGLPRHRPHAGRPGLSRRRTTPAAPTVTLTGDRGSVTLPAEVGRPGRRRRLGARPTRSATACSPTWPRPAAGSP